MLDKGAEIIRQAKEERKNTKMDKTRIIVVEDNIVYCEFVCNLLAREGFRTVQAYHLSTAKKLLQQASDGDIVVSDLRLPDGEALILYADNHWDYPEIAWGNYCRAMSPLPCHAGITLILRP